MRNARSFLAANWLDAFANPAWRRVALAVWRLGMPAGTAKSRCVIGLYQISWLPTPLPDQHASSRAVCVNHPRVKENISLGEIAVRWRRLAGRTGASCTEEAARSLGALLFNRSAQ